MKKRSPLFGYKKRQRGELLKELLIDALKDGPLGNNELCRKMGFSIAAIPGWMTSGGSAGRTFRKMLSDKVIFRVKVGNSLVYSLNEIEVKYPKDKEIERDVLNLLKEGSMTAKEMALRLGKEPIHFCPSSEGKSYHPYSVLKNLVTTGQIIKNGWRYSLPENKHEQPAEINHVKPTGITEALEVFLRAVKRETDKSTINEIKDLKTQVNTLRLDKESLERENEMLRGRLKVYEERKELGIVERVFGGTIKTNL